MCFFFFFSMNGGIYNHRIFPSNCRIFIVGVPRIPAFVNICLKRLSHFTKKEKSAHVQDCRRPLGANSKDCRGSHIYTSRFSHGLRSCMTPIKKRRIIRLHEETFLTMRELLLRHVSHVWIRTSIGNRGDTYTLW